MADWPVAVPAPVRGTPSFRDDADAFAAWWVLIAAAMQDFDTEIGPLKDSAPLLAAIVGNQLVGQWDDLTGSLAAGKVAVHPDSTTGVDALWMLMVNLPDVTTSEPARDNSDWAIMETASKLDKAARASNTALTQADSGKWISATGTWTQTYTGLSAGFYCYLSNDGPGEITITSDGVTYKVYPGELRLFQHDGTALTSKVLRGFSVTFTASGTFTKPPGYDWFDCDGQGAGGSGSSGFCRAGATAAEGGSGGGGGFRDTYRIPASALSATQAIVIGAGGAQTAQATTVSSIVYGNGGGATTFAGYTWYGGSGGGFAYGGGGGGRFGMSGSQSGGDPVIPGTYYGASMIPANARQIDGGGWGGDATQPQGRDSVRGGGGGAAGQTAGGYMAGNSYLGGGGGGCGGGVDSTGATANAGTGGGVGRGGRWGLSSTGTGGAINSNGNNGTNPGDGGGGGGARNNAGAGGDGGTGGVGAGGGGGGGQNNSRGNSGRGGAGGRGELTITGVI